MIKVTMSVPTVGSVSDTFGSFESFNASLDNYLNQMHHVNTQNLSMDETLEEFELLTGNAVTIEYVN